MKHKIKTLVVEDFGMMRLIISNILVRNTDIEVVGTARNGKEGFEKAMLRKPDVIVTDMVMPEYDGMHLVREVMRSMPTPIVLISALEKDSPQIFEALQAGAFDFVDKPGSGESRTAGDDYLIKVIKEAAKVDPAALTTNKSFAAPVQHRFAGKRKYDVVVMGASTGGPKAIEGIVEKLPENLAVPMVIVQHMPQHHLVSFVKRLDGLTPLCVKMVKNGEEIKPGHLYLAPGGSDVVIGDKSEKGRRVMNLSKKAKPGGASIDVLFKSAADVYGERVMAVLLTGMAGEGVSGMKAVYNSGGLTIAQDRKSSLAYGMPKGAIDAGCIKQVLGLQEMPGFIVGRL